MFLYDVSWSFEQSISEFQMASYGVVYDAILHLNVFFFVLFLCFVLSFFAKQWQKYKMSVRVRGVEKKEDEPESEECLRVVVEGCPEKLSFT